MKKINFVEFSKQISSIGREIDLDSIKQTRNLIISQIGNDAICSEVAVERDVTYGEDSRHRLDIFTSSTGKDPRLPLLIFVHGGGFIGGDKYTPGTPFYDNIGVWAVKNGYNAINMTYRLAPEHKWPSGINDIHGVINWVSECGNEFGVSADNIVLMGQSAGAAHAASYVAHPEVYDGEHRLSGLVLLSGVYDFCTMRVSPLERAYLGDDEGCYEARSSQAGLVESELPMLITACEYDPYFFEEQALNLLVAKQKRHKQMPSFVHMTGQNHISAGLTLGLEGDLLAAQLKHFIDNRCIEL